MRREEGEDETGIKEGSDGKRWDVSCSAVRTTWTLVIETSGKGRRWSETTSLAHTRFACLLHMLTAKHIHVHRLVIDGCTS